MLAGRVVVLFAKPNHDSLNVNFSKMDCRLVFQNGLSFLLHPSTTMIYRSVTSFNDDDHVLAQIFKPETSLTKDPFAELGFAGSGAAAGFGWIEGVPCCVDRGSTLLC